MRVEQHPQARPQGREGFSVGGRHLLDESEKTTLFGVIVQDQLRDIHGTPSDWARTPRYKSDQLNLAQPLLKILLAVTDGHFGCSPAGTVPGNGSIRKSERKCRKKGIE